MEYGLADRIDLGVVVPFVKLDMHTRVFSQIMRTATPPTEAEERGNAIPIHAFDPLGLSNRTTYASAHSRGIGDIVVRGKAHLLKTEEGGISVAVNVSLPTGDEEDLLGTGAMRVEARGIWSEQFGRVGAHLNGGYTTSGGSLPSSLTATVDPLSNRAGRQRRPARAAGGDQHRRRRRGGGRVAGRDHRATSSPVSSATPGTSRAPAPRSRRAAPGASPAAVSVASDLRALDPGNLTQILAGIGMRAHIARPLLLSVDVLLPVSGDGLMPKVGVVAGFSLAF